ncbi:MAG: precorrin-3B synthase [Alphaproteobacteria bacterium]|nr:precorrin-3B synthase [Alphaproteobacteria bacterium]MBU0802189.1 precorrin-3B synthase [Alphaproteobacteria bacterium]MBU0872205.1 precorrin-3B synthase [Alphaproteobacteria bacterium]MBU1399688.1 precorrin-3B synthase [Alphaproteobacteria bacterium]MBU1590074.1 precorrin-3B synthase [Alphaproteobacteria bacterium]
MNALAVKASPLAGGFTRRGACPALSAPMQTGDGLLVRLNPVAGGLSPNALIGLCKSALAHGNGVMEVTARGSLQIRGLTKSSAQHLAAEVDALGIAVRTGVPVATGELAGLDPDEIADPMPLAERIRAAIAAAGLDGKLGPKVSVVVDGGGRSCLDEVSADVRLTARRAGPETHWQVALAGDARSATPLTVENEQQATETALSLLSAIAALGPTARARDLSPSAKLPISPLVGEMAGRPEGGTDAATLLGVFPLADARIALGIALPFGHADAVELVAFAQQAASLGVVDIRLAPTRTILALCPTNNAAETLQQAAQSLGFVVTSTDPRTAISACPGSPACASGHIAARELAAAVAHDLADLIGTALHLHISGCAKGCAHPGKAALTVVGSEIGAGIVVDGTARDLPLAYTAPEGARDGLARLAQALRKGGSPSRIRDAEQLAEAFGKE